MSKSIGELAIGDVVCHNVQRGNMFLLLRVERIAFDDVALTWMNLETGAVATFSYNPKRPAGWRYLNFEENL